jgi:hypothetical protein
VYTWSCGGGWGTVSGCWAGFVIGELASYGDWVCLARFGIEACEDDPGLSPSASVAGPEGWLCCRTRDTWKSFGLLLFFSESWTFVFGIPFSASLTLSRLRRLLNESPIFIKRRPRLICFFLSAGLFGT